MRVIGVILLLLIYIAFSKRVGGEVGSPEQWTSDPYTSALLNIARQGLPQTTEPKHVIIIGAGIAGLTAGKLLKDAGHNVTILEASNRVGGRILTYRDPENKYYADLGAMRIPYKHKFVKTFVDLFNLSTSDFIGYDKDTWYFVNGRKLKASEVSENPDLLGFNTSSKERGKSSSQLFDEAMEQVLRECYDDDVDVFDIACLTQYDQYSFKEFLTEVAGLSDGAVEMIGLTWIVDSSFYLAFTEIIRWTGSWKKYEIVGGTDLLPKAYLQHLQNNIVYNSRVFHVEHGNDTVVAHFLSSGRDVTISGDYLLITSTATSTSFIKFTPGLDVDKQNAIRNLHYDSATKIVLVFQRPFWKDEGIFGGASVTDSPSRYIIYPSHDFDSGHGVIIASYTFSDQSIKFHGLSAEECVTQALNDLAEIHGDYIRELYLEGIVKKWSLDTFSLGAFNAPTPYQLRDLYIPIVRPQGNLFFAGEHTNFPHAYMDSAIRSAVEAAHCISNNQCYPNLEMSNGTKSPSIVFLFLQLIMLLANFALCVLITE